MALLVTVVCCVGAQAKLNGAGEGGGGTAPARCGPRLAAARGGRARRRGFGDGDSSAPRVTQT
jgi:hypothetical protein